MNSDRVEIPCKGTGSTIRIGPTRDFTAVEHGGVRNWVAGEFSHSHPEALVAAASSGGSGLSEISIPFALIRQGPDCVVSITTDRYGQVPVYLCEHGDDIWISTSLSWLAGNLGGHVGIDEQALGELLTFKFILGEKTILKDVARVRPASTRTLSHDGTWTSDCYWFPTPPDSRRKLSSELETLTDLFSAGVRECISEFDNVAVTLSGGLDSRAILAAALVSGGSISTLTTGIPGGMDHRYAEMAAATAGVPLRLALLDEPYRQRFFDFTRQSLKIYEGMLLTPGTEALWMIESAADLPIQIVLHGALGELAKGATANHFELGAGEMESCRTDVATLMSSRYVGSHERMMALLTPAIRNRLKGEALQSLEGQATQLQTQMDALDVPFALQILEHFRNSGVYSAKIWRQRFPMMFPFADSKYVDHLLSIRAEDRVGTNFHRELLRRLNDGLYRCPESNTGVAPSASDVARKFSRFRVKVMNKLGMKSAAGHTDFCAWINSMQPSIEDVLLVDSTLGETLFDREQVRKCIERSRHGSQAAASDLYRLFCLELIHRELIG